MRNPDRIDIIMTVLAQVWHENPDWRLTQLMVNTGAVPNLPGMWYYQEDDEFLRGIPAVYRNA